VTRPAPIEAAPTCEACGGSVPPAGVAILCGPGGGTVRLPAPRYCNRRECRAERDRVAIARAIEQGVIDP